MLTMGTNQSQQPLLGDGSKARYFDNMVDDNEALVSEIASREPVRATCPHCSFNGMTKVKKERTACGKVLIVLLAFCCLCCIPCCIKSLNRAVHSC